MYQLSLVFSWNCLYLLRNITLAVSSREPLERKQTRRVVLSTTSFHWRWRAAIKLCNVRKPTGFAMQHLDKKKAWDVQCSICSTISLALNKAAHPGNWLWLGLFWQENNSDRESCMEDQSVHIEMSSWKVLCWIQAPQTWKKFFTIKIN